jgi:hypothetical protein
MSTPCSTCGEQPEHPSHGGRHNSHAYDVEPAQVVARQHADERTPAVAYGEALRAGSASRTITGQRTGSISRCASAEHDHTTLIARDGSELVRPVPMVCTDCGRPTHYDSTIEQYVHDDVDAPGCFLIPERPADATTCTCGVFLSDGLEGSGTGYSCMRPAGHPHDGRGASYGEPTGGNHSRRPLPQDVR